MYQCVYISAVSLYQFSESDQHVYQCSESIFSVRVNAVSLYQCISAAGLYHCVYIGVVNISVSVSVQ